MPGVAGTRDITIRFARSAFLRIPAVAYRLILPATSIGSPPPHNLAAVSFRIQVPALTVQGAPEALTFTEI